jgi:hypothetical protein
MIRRIAEKRRRFKEDEWTNLCQRYLKRKSGAKGVVILYDKTDRSRVMVIFHFGDRTWATLLYGETYSDLFGQFKELVT